MIAHALPMELDALNRPRLFYGTMVHQGCTRNEYHEYNVEETQPGGRGCMYFNLGCQGPGTLATCNSELWNGRSSKTRVGVPCFGCTSPGFPKDGDLFRTDKIGAVPVKLPWAFPAGTTWLTRTWPGPLRRSVSRTGRWNPEPFPEPHCMARTTLNIDLNRVEGDLEFQVDLDGRTVVDARCVGTLFRGFEQLLIGRAPRDGLVITPRYAESAARPISTPPPWPWSASPACPCRPTPP
jgi:hypothetical protein